MLKLIKVLLVLVPSGHFVQLRFVSTTHIQTQINGKCARSGGKLASQSFSLDAQ